MKFEIKFSNDHEKALWNLCLVISYYKPEERKTVDNFIYLDFIKDYYTNIDSKEKEIPDMMGVGLETKHKLNVISIFGLRIVREKFSTKFQLKK